MIQFTENNLLEVMEFIGMDNIGTANCMEIGISMDGGGLLKARIGDWIAKDMIGAFSVYQAPADYRSLKQAVDWILNDASYKDPEILGDIGLSYVQRLRKAVS